MNTDHIFKSLAVPAATGLLVLAFGGCSSQVSEKEAVCTQTGPTSFQIVDIQDRAKPIVLWNAAGQYDQSSGSANRKLVAAFVDYGTFRDDSIYREAKMDLEKGRCGVSNYARSVEPHFMMNYYKLVKQI